MTPKPNAVKSPGYENVHAKILKVVDVESEWNIALIPNSMHSNMVLTAQNCNINHAKLEA